VRDFYIYKRQTNRRIRNAEAYDDSACHAVSPPEKGHGESTLFSVLSLILLWVSAYLQHFKVLECVTDCVLLIRGARFLSLVKRKAVRRYLYRKTTNFFHMGNPAGLGLETILSPHIFLNFLVSCHVITSICHKYLIDNIQKSTRNACYCIGISEHIHYLLFQYDKLCLFCHASPEYSEHSCGILSTP